MEATGGVISKASMQEFYKNNDQGERMRIVPSPFIFALSILILAFGHNAKAQAQSQSQADQSNKHWKSLDEKYTQKTLLKNWALSICLAEIAQDEKTRADANETASAYLEFGRQPIEAYDLLAALAKKYAKLKYGSAIKSELNAMKCIDLFHSKELDQLANKLVKQK